MKIIFGFFLSLFLLCLSSPLPAAEKNIIFFITDDESPTLGCYGDPIAKTPAIDAIAEDGTVFLNAFATTASCSASRSVVIVASTTMPMDNTDISMPFINFPATSM